MSVMVFRYIFIALPVVTASIEPATGSCKTGDRQCTEGLALLQKTQQRSQVLLEENETKPSGSADEAIGPSDSTSQDPSHNCPVDGSCILIVGLKEGANVEKIAKPYKEEAETNHLKAVNQLLLDFSKYKDKNELCCAAYKKLKSAEAKEDGVKYVELDTPVYAINSGGQVGVTPDSVRKAPPESKKPAESTTVSAGLSFAALVATSAMLTVIHKF